MFRLKDSTLNKRLSIHLISHNINTLWDVQKYQTKLSLFNANYNNSNKKKSLVA